MITPNTVDESRVQEYLESIVRYLGIDLTLMAFAITKGTLKKWRKGADLTDTNKKLIMSVYVICETLKTVDQMQAKIWLTGWSEYIYGYPVVEVKSRPQDVLQAAQYYVTRGEGALN